MILEVIDQGRLEKQETEKQKDDLLPYLQDLVQRENKREVEWVDSEERRNHDTC